MRRSFKYQMRPTAKQSQALTAMLKDHCDLYNAALQERRDSYRHVSKTSTSYYDQSAQLSQIRAQDAAHAVDGGVSRWSFSSQQATLRRLNKAFTAFFDRVKKGQTPGYPRFRSVHRFDAVEFPKNGDGCQWAATPKTGTSTWTHVRLQGVGHVKVNIHRPWAGRVKTITVKREGTRAHPKWFVIISCDDVPEHPLPTTGLAVGIDLATGANGLGWLATCDTTTGELDTPAALLNVRAYKRLETKLAAAQQQAAASKPNPGKRSSVRHKRDKDRVRAIHSKIARVRAGHLHKVSTMLVREYDVIVHENLNVKNMTKAPAPKPNPTPVDGRGDYLPNQAAAKAGLNKSILDSGWSTLIGMINVKAECAGRSVIPINPAYTSQECHACGTTDAQARNGKVYSCTNPDCAWTGDADQNAALNILRAGLALTDSSQAAA